MLISVEKNTELHPRDIGAWILEETSEGLKACYQIVALEAPDMIYAIPIMGVLDNASSTLDQTLTLPVSSCQPRQLTLGLCG